MKGECDMENLSKFWNYYTEVWKDIYKRATTENALQIYATFFVAYTVLAILIFALWLIFGGSVFTYVFVYCVICLFVTIFSVIYHWL